MCLGPFEYYIMQWRMEGVSKFRKNTITYGGTVFGSMLLALGGGGLVGVTFSWIQHLDSPFPISYNRIPYLFYLFIMSYLP